MAQPKSVVELLKSQPDEVLLEMEAALKEEIASKQAELALVQGALTRTHRRRRASVAQSQGASEQPRSSGITRADLFHVVAEQGKAVSAPEVREILKQRGVHMATA